MTTSPTLRLYAMLKVTPELEEIYKAKDYAKLTAYTEKILQKPLYGSANLISTFGAVAAPSRDWKPAFVGDDGGSAPSLDELAVVYEFKDGGSQSQFVEITQKVRKIQPGADIRGVGADIGVGSADSHWCPGQARLATFGDRADARRTINAEALTGAALYGQNVNVVIIDQGLNKAAIDPRNWGGGFSWTGIPGNPVTVGTAPRTSHGMMIARSILDLAPAAVLYDVPLIPDRIASVDKFFDIMSTSSAQAVYQTILDEIDARRSTPPWTGPWILVNAWAIFDRETESLSGNYTENNAIDFGFDHPLIEKVKKAVAVKKIDVIFAGGNCGEFCPSRRCGGRDRGPGHSIWGANALPEVITAGAVRCDETWAGYSSQGPGPGKNTLAHAKPDIGAPSDFCETDDASVRNSGTSAACGVTAGIVAALRSYPGWYQTLVTPQKMRQALIDGARKTQGPNWNGRTGNGILDARGAMGRLP